MTRRGDLYPNSQVLFKKPAYYMGVSGLDSRLQLLTSASSSGENSSC